MALSSSPRKVVPLHSGDDSQPSNRPKFLPGLTKRAFFCGVVVESPGIGKHYSEDVQDLVASLGDSIDSNDALPSRPETPSAERSENDVPYTRKRAMTDSSALADQINEFITTERSYVKKLIILKHDYADPLRSFARSKETAILPPYEAKILFGNIDNLLPVNEAFLADLEKMLEKNGSRTVGGLGDVALRHFRDLRGFEHYKQYYSKREEAQGIFERELAKRSSSFAAFIDRIKYSNADIKNRIGLRELLMDPVQRIPRYTLMFRNMIKRMAPDDPQRAKLIEADEIASKIALAETDEQTKRAQVMYCLSATIDHFPPALISNSRRFVDCIDVEDVFSDFASGSGSQGQGSDSLPCSLFLFDDKLLIVKRPAHGEKGARTLSGLDDLDKSTRSTGRSGMKKSGMSSKGVVEVTDIVATDVGGSDIHLYLENPPLDQTERWSGRPFRALTVVQPPGGPNMNPTQTEIGKKKFLENLWTVQAKYRTKLGQSVALCSEEREVESRGGRTTIARTYFNVYQRTGFLREPTKTKVVVHIDPFGSADAIPTAMSAPPFVVIRVQPMAGELCRFAVTSSDTTDEGEQDIIQTERVPGRIVQTIHQYGLFKFSTGNNSRPSTPTASYRSRAAIFGLDAISRNLFNARPGLSSKGDLFGSVSSHKRTKSTISRSSVYTQSTTTGDDSLTRFSRSNSIATAATTMSLMDNESIATSKSQTRNKLVKRGKSPSGSENESSPVRNRSRSRSQSRSREVSRERVNSDADEDEGPLRLDALNLRRLEGLDESELDLAMRLELARKNSENQHVRRKPVPAVDNPVEETIYEDGPPLPLRPSSRASRDSHSQHSHRSTTPRPQSTTPTPDSPPRQGRSVSQLSSERRPMGPRVPSPLPRSPQLSAVEGSPPVDLDLALETTLVNMTLPPVTPTRSVSPLPRSKRQPFEPTGNTDTTPKAGVAPSGIPKPVNSVEPLFIKKRTSVRTSPNPVRKAHSRNSPFNKSSRVISPRRTPQARSQNQTTVTTDKEHTYKAEDLDKLIHLAESTKSDVESSRRAMKRIRLEFDLFRTNSKSAEDVHLASPSPIKGIPRTPQRPNATVSREAQARMDEMRQLIGKRYGPTTPRTPQRNTVETPKRTSTAEYSPFDDFAHSIEDYIFDADGNLAKALAAQDELQADVKAITASLKEKAIEIERSRVELQNTKRQCELVKSLLADATAEKEIMYEAFNEELDSMYNDSQLPEEEAWTALTADLRETKETRNELSKENSHLKRRLAEVEQQKEEWGALLRAHGLIP